MNRIDRLSAILIQLQSKRVVKAQEIADRFGISVRTVYRDIRSLEQAGVPIGSEAGVGYFLSDNYHLPPVMFTSEEAASLLIGAKFVEQMGDKGARLSFESALYKIKSVLKSTEKDHLEQLQEHVSVIRYAEQDETKTDFLHLLQQSIVHKQVLCMAYFTHYSGQESQRLIEPVGLTYYANHWHVIAFCQKRNDYRDFRLDRVKSLQRTHRYFKEKKHLSLGEYFERQQAPEHMPQISLVGCNESLRFIKDSKHWYGFTHQEPYDQRHTRLYFRNADLFGFSRWVVLGGKNVRIESPPELLELANNFANELRNHNFAM